MGPHTELHSQMGTVTKSWSLFFIKKRPKADYLSALSLWRNSTTNRYATLHIAMTNHRRIATQQALISNLKNTSILLKVFWGVE